MNPLKHTIQYLQHLWAAQGKYYLHSPFVYALSEAVIYDKRQYYAFKDIEILRSKLLQSDQIIRVTDYGAGSKVMPSNERAIKQITRYASATPKKGQLLFRLVNYFKPQSILELGTSVGIGSLYLAWANRQAQMHSIEGCPQTAQVAQHNLKLLMVDNVQVHTGKFEEVLPKLLPTIAPLDLIFLDGNHQKQATLDYFQQCIPYMNENTVVVLDDIYWSEEMTAAWEAIQTHPDVTISIDLFKMGLVFFRKGQAKQDFKLWF